MNQPKITSWLSSAWDFRGTFVGNLKAPIHRWFRYSCGFSYALVEESFDRFGVKQGDLVLDPFTGCGTVNVCAKRLGIHSIGIEAHPFVAWVARVKTFWDYDLSAIKNDIDDIATKAKDATQNAKPQDFSNKPKLLKKLYSDEILSQLYAIKSLIDRETEGQFKDFCTLALLNTLRKVSSSRSSFPYVIPRKKRVSPPPAVHRAYSDRLNLMYNDLAFVLKGLKESRRPPGQVDINNDKESGDARDLSFIDRKVDFAFTSPPYLNNVDYADSTRLELYFLGQAESWRELTQKIRSKLIISASHQAKELNVPQDILPRKEIVDDVRDELIRISTRLRELKDRKGGKKDYDIMCIAYFNDMESTFEQVHAVLKPNSHYLMVLGDSAPYGVHIPTDVFLAKIAKGVGFRTAGIEVLRMRGDKWKSLTKKRRHNVPLRESLIVLKK